MFLLFERIPHKNSSIFFLFRSFERSELQAHCQTLVCALFTESENTYVGKYDQADDRPKLAMLAIDIGPMIDRGLDDTCGPILACYIRPKIAPDERPRITARVKPMTF